ncbi:MAG: AAA family ATPase [Candidatus Aenigmatarchaeota archaeon]
MITKVRLKNWRSHLNSTLEFSKGTNALIGIMGSGKTSILNSICFGLFGTTPEIQSRKLKLDDLIMNKPYSKDTAEVEVFFRINGNEYSVKRIIEKKKGTTYSELRENGKLIEAPSTQRVNELVEKILKVDYELFSKAIYSEQNALDYFLTIPKGQRMKKIDELLMIDKFEKARSNTISLINKISEKKSTMESLLGKVNLTELQQMVTNIKSSLENIILEKSQLEKELKQVVSTRQAIENELKILYKTKENLEILKRDEASLSSAVNELSSSIKELEESVKNADKEEIEKNVKSFTDILDKLENTIREKQEEYQKLADQYSKAKAEADIYKKETIARLQNELEEKLQLQRDAEKIKKQIGDDADAALEKKRGLVEKYVGKIEALRIKIEDLSNIIDQLSSIKAKCPICESKITEEKKVILIKQKKMQIKNLYEEMEYATKQKQINEQELRDLEVAVNKLNKILDAIEGLSDLKNNLENTQHIYAILEESSIKLEHELKTVKNEIEKMNKTLTEARNQKQKLELMLLQIRDYESKKSRIDTLIKQREEIIHHLKSLEKTIFGRDLHAVETELRNLVGKEKEISTRISALNQLLSERESRLKDLESTLTQATKEKEEIKKLENLIIQLRVFEKALEETQIQLRQEFVTLVNYSMNQLWQTLYPYQDFTGIRLKVEEGDYVLQLLSRNEWVNVEGVASGGERNIAALTLRISFSLVLAPNLRLLILDEPTANMDTKSIKVLADTLRERIGEFIDQCFLITHQSELEDAVTGYAYRLERDKSIDGYTQVIRLN